MLKELITLVSGLYYAGGCLGGIDYLLAEKLRREEKGAEKPTNTTVRHKKINILLPALFEENVIASTLDNVATLDHPNYKITIITNACDPKTAEVARNHIEKMGYKNAEVKVYDYNPRTKPSALDYAFSDLKEDCDIIGILDAENWFERRDVLKKVETYFEDPGTGAVQTRIIPVYEKNGWWRQMVQLTACTEFANLYSLPSEKEVEEDKTAIGTGSDGRPQKKCGGNLFGYGKMSIKNRFTTPFLGGTGCFYSADAMKELAKIRDGEPVPGPFDPHGLVDDFQSAVNIIGKLSEPKKVVYDPENCVYAYFPDTFRRRLKQATRWSAGKLKSMFETNTFRLKATKAKKFELLREYFFNAVPATNFVALGYLAWSMASNYLGIGPPAPNSDLTWITIPPTCYTVVSTSEQIYKTCKLYGKRVLGKDTGKYFVASLFNQSILQPLANIRAYGKILHSYVTGKPNEWEKTHHQKINLYNTEGVNNHDIKRDGPKS